MNRADMRRAKRGKLTVEETNIIKKQAYNEAVCHASVLMFAVPIKVCHEQLGWTKEHCGWFAEAIEKEFKNFSEGNMTPQEYADVVGDLTGWKFEVV